MKRSSGNPLSLYTLGIVTLFLAGFLLLVIFGARSYQNTLSDQNEKIQSRTLLAYLSTTIRAHDEAESISVSNQEDRTVLTLSDGTTGYEFRIYQRDGKLLEEYTSKESPLNAEQAQLIGETEVFQITFEQPDQMIIETDEGRVNLHLRSGESED